MIGTADPETHRVRLNCDFLRSEITDVALTTIAQGPKQKPLSLQVPLVKNQACNISADLMSGETLLLHPLQETSDHRRSYIVITPTVVPSKE